MYIDERSHHNNDGDKMKILIVNGSRREGNSYNLSEIMKEKLGKERIICDIITPGNQKIYLCTGCMDCDEKGVCDFKDDMTENIEKIRKADVIIFITPTRWNLLSGDIKIFMDRLNPLYTTEELKNKKAISIAIGSKEAEEFSEDGAITSIGSFCDSAGMKLILHQSFYDCLDFEDILQQQDKIDQLIEKIKEQLKDK